MATNLVINGVSYSYPNTGDQQWGDNATNWAIAVTNGMLQKAGGLFTLTADVNFGASFGVISQYFKSAVANIAASGVLRLANADAIAFRNSGNSADLLLQPHSDGILQYNSVDLATISASQTLTNKTISGASNTLTVRLASDVTGNLPLANMASIASNTILGNNTGGSATPTALTTAQVNTLLGSLSNPMTTQGDIIYGGASGTPTRLALGATQGMFLRAGSTSPAWAFPTVTSQTTTYAILASDDIILCSGSAFTVTLPTAASIAGKQYYIKKTDSSLTNIITIATTSAQTIDGASSYTLNTQYESLTVVSDGSNWQILNHSIPSVWTSYTPTFTAFGTVSNVNFVSKREGDSVLIVGSFTTGTCTAATGQITMGVNGINGITSSSSGKIPSIQIGGQMTRADTGGSAGAVFNTLINSSRNYFTFGYNLGGSTGGLTEQNGNALSNAITVAVTVRCPITGWNG